MEVFDLHAQFEELVTEMQTLHRATALIDDTAKSSGAVVAQSEELLDAATSLLQRAGSTFTQAAEELSAEAEALHSLQSDVRSALAGLQQAARDQVDHVETAMKHGLDAQGAQQQEAASRTLEHIEQAGERYQERLDQVHRAVVQFTKAQRGVSAEVKSGFASAAQRRTEYMEATREKLITIVSEGHHQIHQSVSKRIDRMEAALVEQGRMNLDGIQAQRDDMHTFTRRVTWAAFGVLGLQVAVVLSLWYFL